MGIFSRKQENPQPPQEEEQKDQEKDIDKMLDDPKFTAFLIKYFKDRMGLTDDNSDQIAARHDLYQQIGPAMDQGFENFLHKFPDQSGEQVELSDDMADEVMVRFERYQQVGKTIKEVQSILASEMSSEISTESTKLKINPSEIEGAKEYVENLAVNDEDAFNQILKDVEQYRILDKETDEIQAEIDQKIKVLENKEKTLGDVKSTGKWKRWTGIGLNAENRKTYDDARKQGLHVRRTSISENELNTEQEEIDQIDSELDKKIDDFNSVRKKLMSSLGEQTGALQVAKNKLTKHLNEGFGTSLSDVDKLSSTYGELSDDEDNGELSFNYFENEGFDRGEFIKKLNAEAETRVTKEIKDAINLSPLVQGQMGKLESTLDRYMKREQLGRKDQEETKKFVLGVVHEMYSRFAKDYQNPDHMNKSYLLQRILIKNGVEKPNEDYAKSMMDQEEKKRQEDEAAAKAEEEKQRQEEEAAAKAAQNDTESSDDANNQASTEPASSTANQSNQQPGPTPTEDEINPDDNQII